jgi:hypothetical protein
MASASIGKTPNHRLQLAGACGAPLRRGAALQWSAAERKFVWFGQVARS